MAEFNHGSKTSSVYFQIQEIIKKYIKELEEKKVKGEIIEFQTGGIYLQIQEIITKYICELEYSKIEESKIAFQKAEEAKIIQRQAENKTKQAEDALSLVKTKTD